MKRHIKILKLSLATAAVFSGCAHQNVQVSSYSSYEDRYPKVDVYDDEKRFSEEVSDFFNEVKPMEKVAKQKNLKSKGDPLLKYF